MLKPLALALAATAMSVAAPREIAQQPALAGASVEYGPSPRGDETDAKALAGAKATIDMAAYVLTDRPIIAALSDAAARGVAVRIYLDREQADHMGSNAKADLAALAAIRGVAIRTKARGEAMHLKSWLVDRRVLRTGSANFSWSGERYQDNDVAILESPVLAAAFQRNFETMWARPDNEAFAK